jgi:Tyrosyl-DNA phosphodiesterase
LVRDKTTKEPKLNCRNWECGVVFSVPQSIGKNLVNDEAEGHAPIGMDVFHGYVPVPMITPGTEYGARRPVRIAMVLNSIIFNPSLSRLPTRDTIRPIRSSQCKANLVHNICPSRAREC